MIFRMPLAKGTQQHLHAVVVPVPLNLTGHSAHELARWSPGWRLGRGARRAGSRTGKDLLHPPLRAAEALGDDKCATTDRMSASALATSCSSILIQSIVPATSRAEACLASQRPMRQTCSSSPCN